MTRAIVLLLALGGCASARHGESAAEPTARRMYTAGEARFAAGEPEQAVSLWRRAITQLPPTEQYDAVRHKLILRLAFGQLVAYEHSGNLDFLFDAKQMLDRYLVTHGELFGEGAAAKAERDQVYELLTEAERLLEDPPVELAATSARDRIGGAGDGAPSSATAESADTEVATDGTAPAETRRRRTRPKDDAEGDERLVVVDTKKRPSVDDPDMKRKLRSWSPEAGAVLVQPTVAKWLPQRSYVRLDGRASRLDAGQGGPAAQAVASDLLRSVRPALRACYDGAYARAPADYALATVELTVTPEGTVATPRIVEGVVGDADGDVCVLEGLEGAKLAELQPDAAMTLAVPLMFFFDNAVGFNEGTGRSVRSEMDLMLDSLANTTSRRMRARSADVPNGMAPIDAKFNPPIKRRTGP